MRHSTIIIVPKLYISILLACTPTCSIATKFSQDWESEVTQSNGELSTFSLHIEINGNNVTGRYCAIYRNGNKIDCSTIEENNIFGKIENNLMTVSFNSFFNAKSGIASISLKDDNLTWKITKAPQGGEFYAPKNAILHPTKKQHQSNII